MATFIQLTNFKSSEEKEIEYFNHDNKYVVKNQDVFSKIHGSPIVYWVNNKIRNIFYGNAKISASAYLKQGLATSDNNKFLRLWYEVDLFNIGFYFSNRNDANKSGMRWFPLNKGGGFRKWFGNNEYVINWMYDGKEIKKAVAEKYPYLNGNTDYVVKNQDFYFKPGLSWSKVSSSNFAVRYSEKGYIFSDGGMKAFTENDSIYPLASYLNSKLTSEFVNIISQTLNFEQGNISKLPFISLSVENRNKISFLAKQCIDISREEWDSRETSWDFTTNEFLRHKATGKIEDAYNTYCTYWKDQFFKLHANEEELNRIFIDIYDLADELTPDVPLEDITILKEESDIKDSELVFKKETLVKQFISYAVGYMFGRYSLDREGLIIANQGETIDDFIEKVPDASFMPDDDNIIPILEDEYFRDDIVSRFREFLKVTFGAVSLAENLEFIAGALSESKKGGGSPEKVIRDYFLKSFFKDHVKMYKKRPIYWLFTSGKGRGFNALVYMHRYDRETLAKMRTDYLLELEAKLDARIGMLGDEAAAEKGRLGKQVEELMDYDAVLNNKALEYIDIDLDDGVKVNYAKFEGLVGKV